jgi:hypothetical protein
MQGQKKDEKESLKPNRIKLSSNFLRLHCALTECNSDLLWLISLPEFTLHSPLISGKLSVAQSRVDG